MNQHIPKAHDHFFKAAMKDLRVAQDFFRMHLPQDLQQTIQWESLELEPTMFANRLRNETANDIVFGVLADDTETYLHLLIEHQSTPDILMPFRAENYRYNLIDAYVKRYPETLTIPLVIPIVLYHGLSPWSYSMDICTLVDAPERMVNAYAFKPFIFVDLSKFEDEALREHLWSGVMQLALKHIFARDILPHIEAMMTLLHQLKRLNAHDLVNDVLIYVYDRGEMNEDAFLNLVRAQLEPDVEEKIMSPFEQALARNMQQGMQQGVQQGMHLANLETARALLGRGMPVISVAEVTKLSVDEVQALAEKMQESRKSQH